MSSAGAALEIDNPRVYFRRHDLPKLRGRAEVPPYAGWYQSIRQQVDALRRPEFCRDVGAWRRTDQWLEVRDLQRSGIAMRAAFLGALTEEAVYRDLARLLLLDYFADETEYWGDHSLHGRIIAQWGLTYDFLGAELESDRAAVREKLRRAAMSLYDANRSFLAHHLLHHANNYSTRTLAGVGLCGLAIDEPVLYDTTPLATIAEDDSWVHGLPPAGAMLNTLLMHQHGVVARRPVDPADPPAGLAVPYLFPEGPGYLAYSADLYLPFYLALRRLHPHLFNPLFDLQGTPADFLRAWHLGQLQLSMPDGQRPPIKDSDGGGPLEPLLSSIYEGDDAELFYWDALRAGGRGGDVEQFCLYEPPKAAPAADYQPPFRSAYHETWGMAALRTGWGPEDLYLFVGGGKGGSRLRCYQHEHADPAQFVLHACGKLLAIDSGYGGWGDPPSDWHHEMVWGPRNHNMLLVRDERTGEDVGPPPPDNGRMALLARIDAARLYGVGDATLERLFRQEVREFGADTEVGDFCETDYLVHCQAFTSYQGLLFERDFFLVDRRWVLLVDTIAPLQESAQAKVVRQYLHGIGYRKAPAGRPGRRPIFGLSADGTYYTAPDEIARGWNRGVWRAAAGADDPEARGGGPVALYAHTEAPGLNCAGRLSLSHGDALHASRRGRALGQRPQRRHTYSVASLEVDFAKDPYPWLVTLLHPCADIDRSPVELETWSYGGAWDMPDDARGARLRGLAVRFRERSLGSSAPADGAATAAGDEVRDVSGLYLIEQRQGAGRTRVPPVLAIPEEPTMPRLDTDAVLTVARIDGEGIRWIAAHDGTFVRVWRGLPDQEIVEHVAQLSSLGTLILERSETGPWTGHIHFLDGDAGTVVLRLPGIPRNVELSAAGADWRYDEAGGGMHIVLPPRTDTRFTIAW
ncbi:MAG: heparinase II/III family protein [Chloroflexi bacterium]|nr:heparinase II/III family protein [Chloroflexota bacterium]